MGAEKGDDGKSYGYFSTIYVEPASRGQGVATRRIDQVETWVRNLGFQKIIYNTAHDNAKLHRLRLEFAERECGGKEYIAQRLAKGWVK